MVYWGKADPSEDWGSCYLWRGEGYLPVTILGIIKGLKSGDMKFPQWDHEYNFLTVSSALSEFDFKDRYEDSVIPKNILDMAGLAPPAVSDPTDSHSTIR